MGVQHRRGRWLYVLEGVLVCLEFACPHLHSKYGQANRFRKEFEACSGPRIVSLSLCTLFW